MAVADTRTTETSQVSAPPPWSQPPSPAFPIADDGPVIQNVVSAVNLGCTLDVKAIAVRARNTEYNPEKSAALIMRIREPKTTAIIFSSGKLLCTGAKTERLSLVAARKFARIIQKLGFDVKFKGFKILNLVASYDLACPLSLTHLGTSHSEISIYETELFPGLIYRMNQLPKVMVMAFASGKIVIAGAEKREEIFKAFKEIYPILISFRRDKSSWRKC